MLARLFFLVPTTSKHLLHRLIRYLVDPHEPVQPGGHGF